MHQSSVLDRRAAVLANGTPWFEQIRVSLELVSPEEAKRYLESNKENYRTLRPGHVKRLAQDMVDGYWQFTNATIGIDVNGILTDGQHRLAAVVESGVDCWMLVVRGMPDGSADNPATDTGAKRSVSTHLSKHGVANPHIVAAAARLLFRLRGGGSANQNAKANASDTKVARIVAANPSIEEAASYTIGCKSIGMPSVFAAWFWLARHENESLAIECTQILEGDKEAMTTHPFAKLRDSLIQMRTERKKYGNINGDLQMRLSMAAWKRAMLGESVKLLRPVKALKISDAADEALQRMAV